MKPEFQNISVMVIDDEQLVMDSLLAYLDDAGFISSGFTVPQEALQMIRTDPPDVCIVDLRLPGMNGEQLIKEILQSAPKVRCLIHTGSFYQISEELKALGMSQDDVIQKPVQVFQLLYNKIANIS